MLLVAVLLGMAAVATGFAGLFADAHQAATLITSIIAALAALVAMAVATKKSGS
jgi:hypothetical protein